MAGMRNESAVSRIKNTIIYNVKVVMQYIMRMRASLVEWVLLANTEKERKKERKRR